MHIPIHQFTMKACILCFAFASFVAAWMYLGRPLPPVAPLHGNFLAGTPTGPLKNLQGDVLGCGSPQGDGPAPSRGCTGPQGPLVEVHVIQDALDLHACICAQRVSHDETYLSLCPRDQSRSPDLHAAACHDSLHHVSAQVTSCTIMYINIFQRHLTYPLDPHI